MRNVSDKVCRDNKKTHFVFSTFFFGKWCRFLENVEKHYRVGQTTNDNSAHAHFMLDTYKHTLRICNSNNFFSTATMATRTRLSVTCSLPALFRLPYVLTISDVHYTIWATVSLIITKIILISSSMVVSFPENLTIK
jgi:hypothetical protein